MEVSFSECSGLVSGGDGPLDGPDPADVADWHGEEHADSDLEDSALELFVFLCDGDEDWEPEGEEEAEEASVLFHGTFEFETVEGSFVNFAHCEVLKFRN